MAERRAIGSPVELIPGDTVLLPASDLAAILSEVRGQEKLLKEHEARLDKQSEYIKDLRFREEQEPPTI